MFSDNAMNKWMIAKIWVIFIIFMPEVVFSVGNTCSHTRVVWAGLKACMDIARLGSEFVFEASHQAGRHLGGK